jgi:hypothetical protein
MNTIDQRFYRAITLTWEMISSDLVQEPEWEETTEAVVGVILDNQFLEQHAGEDDPEIVRFIRNLVYDDQVTLIKNVLGLK